MSSRDLRLPLFSFGVFAVAIVFGIYTWPIWPTSISPLLMALIAAAMLSESLSIEYASINFSITQAVWAAATILLGPMAGAIVSALSSLPAAMLAKERRVIRGVFNFGQLMLTALLAGWAYMLSGGRIILRFPFVAAEMPRMIVCVLLLTVTAFLVNSTLVSMVVSIHTGVRFDRIWRSAAGWTVYAEAAITVLALALAQVVASDGVVGLALFVIPLMIARQFYERYVTLRRTYADTIRSLVAVIEAKDAYTRGHSERVATYAVDVARRLGFGDERVERVELAALLHDLGKVGISRTILAKDSCLSDEEFEVIKSHPKIGAHIIQEVPFLADLVPYIAGHHERFDGTGYGSQLRGEEIPLEARLLGVVDAFDAMTSSRPYRRAMSPEETIRELRRCSGAQFDQVIVETFVEAITTGGLPVLSPAAADNEAV